MEPHISKQKCKNFLKLIKEIEHSNNRICTFDYSVFSFLHESYQLHLMIYLFSSVKELHRIQNLNEIFKHFSNNKTNLLELINKMIETNNYDSLNYILQNKESELDLTVYKKLKDYTLSLRLFDIMKLLTRYESNDFILYKN